MTDKPPSAYAVEAVMSAWQRARAQILRDNPDMDEAALAEYLGPEGADVNEIQIRLIRKYREAQGNVGWLERERADLAIREARFEREADRCKSILMMMLVAQGKKNNKLPNGTIWINAGKEGMRVTDEGKVPIEYFKQIDSLVLEKNKLLDDLKQGVVVDGAELSNPMPYLTIKVK